MNRRMFFTLATSGLFVPKFERWFRPLVAPSPYTEMWARFFPDGPWHKVRIERPTLECARDTASRIFPKDSVCFMTETGGVTYCDVRFF